ncbi:MAG: fumarate hydratase [Raoultibacter sp.]|jgi:fumarate hydratase subunit alpha
MKTIEAQHIANLVEEAIPRLAFELPADVLCALQASRERETSLHAQTVLDHLIENAKIASEDQVPICQDTGTVWVCLEVGPDIEIPSDVFLGVNAAVARAYERARLRKSLVRDSLLDRTNTGDNTPAFCELYLSEKPGARLHLMLKGGGSDNASRVVMLTPASGKQGIIDELLTCVKEKAANACAPVVIGIGVGASFDKVGGLAKRALMRKIDEVNENPELAVLEEELCALVNASGAGPGGLGGYATALAVKINTAPSHIAALPLAINMGCSAMRRETIEL